ncbi:MAG: tetratricopeptide repeat protein [Geobacteraceae bacterium]|nr:tetratricopeptide repeat protein [Geobacteraceae bacterium]
MPLNVLIMNQSRDLCGVLCRFFRAGGDRAECNSEVRLAECKSLDAKTTLSKSRPDLIIVEITMHESNAIAILDGLQKSAGTKNIPIIVISDFAELEFELNNYLDFILKPIDLRRLREDVEILKAGKKKRGSDFEFRPLNSSEHQQFHDFLIKHCGLHFERRNIKVLERALKSRMELLHIGSYNDYFDYLEKNMERRQELQKLLQLLTVGETFFFRYHAHFDVLAKSVLSALTGTKAKKSLRIWSAGCSTGEEPYTIAMTIMEALPDWKRRDIKILATDINNRSLKRAKDGVYSAWKMRVTPQYHIDKYFKRIGESYIVKDEVKSLVEFDYCNLQSTLNCTQEPFDIIFCRNVMIYFTTATTRKVVEMFADHLNPGGYLFMGHSETLLNVSSRFERHTQDGNFYYSKKVQPAIEAIKFRVNSPATTEKPTILSNNSQKAPLVPSKLQDSVSAEELFGTGLNLLHQEHYPEAEEIFRDVLGVKPEHTGAILALGQIHLVNGRNDEALACCDQSLAINDLLPEGYFLRGLLFEMAERITDAIEEYRKAVLLKIDFVMPHYQLGKLSYRTGDVKTSVRELRNCIKLLEKAGREAVIPFSGGLSREVFLEQARKDMTMVEATNINQPELGVVTS